MKCVTRSENEQMNNLVKRYARYYSVDNSIFHDSFFFFLLFLRFFFLRLRIFVPFYFMYFFSFFFSTFSFRRIYMLSINFTRERISIRFFFFFSFFFLFLLFLFSFCNVYITCKGSSIRWSRNVEETHKHPPIDLYWSRRI